MAAGGDNNSSSSSSSWLGPSVLLFTIACVPGVINLALCHTSLEFQLDWDDHVNCEQSPHTHRRARGRTRMTSQHLQREAAASQAQVARK